MNRGVLGVPGVLAQAAVIAAFDRCMRDSVFRIHYSFSPEFSSAGRENRPLAT
jgi:hypothetical protein